MPEVEEKYLWKHWSAVTHTRRCGRRDHSLNLKRKLNANDSFALSCRMQFNAWSLTPSLPHLTANSNKKITQQVVGHMIDVLRPI